MERHLKGLGDFLGKYKRLRAPEGTVLLVFKEVIEELFPVTFDVRHVRFDPKSKTLFLKVSGPLKHEIMLAQKEILMRLRAVLGDNAPRAIV